MYAEIEVLFPYFQNFWQEQHLELQHLEEFCRAEKTNVSRRNLVQTSAVSEYDLGGEGDLFKAPEPIIEEPMIGLDSMTAISVISCGEDAISPQNIKVTDIESIQSEHLLSEVFYDCKKDLLEKSAIGGLFHEAPDVMIPAVQMEDPIAETDKLSSKGQIKSVPKFAIEGPVSGAPDVIIPAVLMEEDPIAEKDELFSEGAIQKSVSSGCLSSMEWIHGGAMRPNFLDFQGMDFGAAYGMKRAFSEGDIQTLGNGNVNLILSPYERTIGNYTIEERKQMLSRYRKKKSKRNFGRKIKYACRKALADSQPRFRGRFAKTEESECPKKKTI